MYNMLLQLIIFNHGLIYSEKTDVLAQINISLFKIKKSMELQTKFVRLSKWGKMKSN